MGEVYRADDLTLDATAAAIIVGTFAVLGYVLLRLRRTSSPLLPRRAAGAAVIALTLFGCYASPAGHPRFEKFSDEV